LEQPLSQKCISDLGNVDTQVRHFSIFKNLQEGKLVKLIVKN
jgi:hypothetical protein